MNMISQHSLKIGSQFVGTFVCFINPLYRASTIQSFDHFVPFVSFSFLSQLQLAPFIIRDFRYSTIELSGHIITAVKNVAALSSIARCGISAKDSRNHSRFL
jgi:hypothetical protein